jgi:hypothetical protein
MSRVFNQEKKLLELVKKAEKTAFGEIHHFSKIKTIQDFYELVPPQSFESHLSFIEEAKKDKSNQL